MTSRTSLAGLSDALGADVLCEHAPTALDGVELAATLVPRDPPELARALAALSRLSLGAVVRGGGSGLAIGNPPRRAALWLSTERVSGIDELDAGEGVCHALAGTPLSTLREAARNQGWELPLDAPGAAATLGGALAAAEVGPRSQGFGRPRDLVLGLEVALAHGERTRCGGRVVKNVTGYDLNKLYTGSFGTLGVIEGAWLRLRPLPERTLVLETSCDELEGACAIGLAAARCHTARAAALVLPEALPFSLVVELAGDAPSVERDADALAEETGAVPAAPQALGRLRALQSATPGAEGLRFRLALLPSRLAPALASLRAFGFELLAYPGLGLVWAAYPSVAPDPRNAADVAWSRVARVARQAGGSFRLEAAPPWAKRGRDVFGEPGPALPLIAALKRRFDPDGVLNAGRFVGQL